MRCEEARRALLEAEPATLRPGESDDLGRHLDACERCRRAAARILEGNRALNEWFDRAPALDVDAVVADAAGAPRRTGRLVRWGAALAAAASLAALLLVGREASEVTAPSASPSPPPAVAAAPLPDLALPPGRNAVVLETRDPDITVIWLYGEGP